MPNQSPLKEALKDRGVTQRELARKLRTGETQVSAWCRGHVPNPKNRERIAKALGIEAKEIWP